MNTSPCFQAPVASSFTPCLLSSLTEHSVCPENIFLPPRVLAILIISSLSPVPAALLDISYHQSNNAKHFSPISQSNKQWRTPSILHSHSPLATIPSVVPFLTAKFHKCCLAIPVPQWGLTWPSRLESWSSHQLTVWQQVANFFMLHGCLL